MSSIRTNSYGGEGGKEFAMQTISELGLRTGAYVDQIKINGKSHGGNGGTDLGAISLGFNEYISKVDLRSGKYVDNVKFTTNHDRTIGGGGSGGSASTLSNIRVLKIGGRSGAYVDKLSIMYVENYKPSTILQQNVGFILSYTSPFQELYEYENSKTKTYDSYEKVTESMMSQTYSASVEGEYFAKVSASTELQFTNTSLTTIKSELQVELESGSHKTIKINEGYVGILLVQGTMMRSAEGECWMYPTSELSYSVIKIDDYKNVLEHYDLTGELYTQMPGLKAHKVIKNNYVYYNA